MMKKTTMIVMAAAAMAIAAPATAAAEWRHHGQPLASNANIQETGQTKIQGEVGNIECQTVGEMQLLAGQTTARLIGFSLRLVGLDSPTDKCQVGGGLATLGCTDVASLTTDATPGVPWTVHAVGTTTLTGTFGTAQYHLHGGIFCPKTVQITPGTVHYTMTTDNTWTQGQRSGQLQVHVNGISQTVNMTGSLVVIPQGTYGTNAH